MNNKIRKHKYRGQQCAKEQSILQKPNDNKLKKKETSFETNGFRVEL